MHVNEGVKYVALQAYEEPMPFPQRLSKAMLDKHFGKYSETLKKVYSTISFFDLVVQMPQLANFVKGVLDHDHNCASVNIMPSSVYDKLGLKNLKPSSVSLQMADRTIRLLKGVIEDVLVRVGELDFLVDFVVMDMTEDHKIPIIFGRPFLATSQAVIDVLKRKVTIRA
ncbi:uncharacterized protein LOC110698333 [Chenopodium quinoa]|uniref:uncharacterized protein LOC110698333 n=1 Tax=Chenopodium quinoa TaxID=63459 RepID=UPI000B780C6D|nr:uncharacterized protein LOC110698333 [Chenopodium quinoa]